MPNEMTFQQEGDYIVCYIDGVEVSRAKKAADGTSTAEVIDIINDQIKANPTLAGTEPNLEGLEVGDNKYAVPQGSGGATLEDIVDSADNRRFIEGIVPIESLGEIIVDYNKWSLSGTHLMLVTVLRNNSGSDLSIIDSLIFSLELPNWIMSKIIPDSNDLISTYAVYDFNRTGACFVDLKKIDGKLKLYGHSSNATIKMNSSYRIQIDLLIDSN